METTEQPTTVKFGGTSMADASQVRKVARIVTAEPCRRYVVVSAPGERQVGTRREQKITRLLRLCCERAANRLPLTDAWQEVVGRYVDITRELGLRLDVEADLAAAYGRLDRDPAYVESRGEYLSARLMAEFLDVPFVDAAKIVRFDRHGQLNYTRTKGAMREHLLQHERAVVPGYYGAAPDGRIVLFPQGGSDISGALVARYTKSRCYENWTDVSGVLCANPKVVQNPRTIELLTYRELRELAAAGAEVVHPAALVPLRTCKIPVHVRNTNDPDHSGTVITADGDLTTYPGTITGISGAVGYTTITVERLLMDEDVGFAERALGVLRRHGVSLRRMPSGVDTVSLVVKTADLTPQREQVLQALRTVCRPDDLKVTDDLALVVVVGRGMAQQRGIAAKAFGALADAGVNVRTIDQGASEISMTIGVLAVDFETAVRALHGAFFA